MEANERRELTPDTELYAIPRAFLSCVRSNSGYPSWSP